MSKPPPKVGTGATPKPRPPCSKGPQTQAATAAQSADKQTVQRNRSDSNNSSENTKGDVAAGSTLVTQESNDATLHLTPYTRIAEMLVSIIRSNALSDEVKTNLRNVIKVAREANSLEEGKGTQAGEQLKVSDIRNAIYADLGELHNILMPQILQVQKGCETILQSTGSLHKELLEAKANTKVLVNEISKVTDSMNKLASATTSYRDALVSKPPQTNSAVMDPKVLSSIECRSKQILIDIWDKAEDNILTKSLTSILEKANEAIDAIADTGKLTGTKVVAALKTRGKAILLTLNSKEAVSWISSAIIRMEFTEKFSADSQVRQHSYNLIVPRVPVIFDPNDVNHLRELEEANNLSATISKAKWIKPLNRRRADQTNAYAMLSLSSADSANLLIRDGLLICGTKVWPKKQKTEPIQCMKCRNWGHFASACPSQTDVCGTCGEAHHTTACHNRGKLRCVSCNNNSHASWSRDCPEFNRRCSIYDERNPENAMPYFPSEQDWSLLSRPHGMPLADKFPAKFAVNYMPYTDNKRPGTAPFQRGKGPKRGVPEKGKRENPNFIPILDKRSERDDLILNGEGSWALEREDFTHEANATDEPHPYDPTEWL